MSPFLYSPYASLFLTHHQFFSSIYFSNCFKAKVECSDKCRCTDCGNISIGNDDDTKPAAEPTAGTLEAAPAGPKPITSRDAPQVMEPAKAADKIDVTPDSVYHPVISEHAAV